MTTSPAVAAHRRRRAHWRLWPYLLLAPALLFFVAFDYAPLVRVVVLSLQSTDLFGRPSGFVGLDNYVRAFTDPGFFATLTRTLLFTVGSVVAKMVVGVLIALPLSSQRRVGWLARPVVLIPMAVSVAVAGVVFRAIFQPGSGLADQILASLGLSSPGWLTNPDVAMVTVIIVDVWVSLGFTVLVLLAALSSVPEEIREAASLDGAGSVRIAISIVLPTILPTLLFLVITHTIGALREFTVINVVTGGGPADATRTLVMDIWQLAFGAQAGTYGEASARAMVLFVVVAMVSFAQFRYGNRRES